MHKNNPKKHTEDFKKSIVTLHESGKNMSQLSREYNVSMSAIKNWVTQYSEVKIDNDTVMTAQQIRELQKKLAILEEENIILKKAIAIFTPHSKKDLIPFYYYNIIIKISKILQLYHKI